MFLAKPGLLKGCCLVLLCCIAETVQAQYYYQDIYLTQRTNATHAEHIRENVRRINIVSYDVYHAVNKGFTCTRVLSDDNLQMVTHTASIGTGSSVVVSVFNDSGRIVGTTDSTAQSVNQTRYYYDSVHPVRIDSLVFSSSAIKDKDTFLLREVHLYRYDDNGILQQMTRKKNDAVYSLVTFSSDSSGRIIKESEQGQHASPPPVYYKYNAEGNITDIFHYNAYSQKMEPDFLFDYDAQGRLSEKTTVMMNTNDYLLWKYTYNDRGLVSKETCYGKKNALQGTLEYEYTY